MGAVSSLFVRKVVRAVGPAADQDALLRSIGLDPDDPSELGVMVNDAQYYGLLERIAEQTGGAVELPLRTGASMHCDDYGAFGLAWKTAPTLRGSFARAERYWRLLTSVTEYEVRSDAGDALFLLHRAGERRLGLRMSNEASLASVVSLIREVAPEGFAPKQVYFRHPAPPETTAHEAYFGCKVTWEAEMDALRIDGAALGHRNRLGDEGVTQFLLSHLDEELKKYGGERGLRDKTHDAIAQSLSEGVPKIGQIARQLGMSERSLQRRLGEEALSFRDLVDGARQELAEGLLRRSDYSIADVAFLTGFSEQSAFTRAFRRWRDETPADFRGSLSPL